MIINKKSPNLMAGFYVIFKGTTFLETPENYGISHLLEHLMCNKLRKYYDEFDRYSVDFNAYTSKTEVVFHITGLNEYIERFRDIFLDALLNFEITKAEFDTERKIVIEEYNDVFQNQFECHYTNLIRKEYGHYSEIGEKKALKKLNVNDVVSFYKQYFTKPTMIINISQNEYHRDVDFLINNLDLYTKKTDKLIVEKCIEFDKLSILGHNMITDNFIEVIFLCNMLGGSLSSPLVQEIREKNGYTYHLRLGIDIISDNQAILVTNVLTDPKNREAVYNLYEKVLSNPNEYVTKERFDIVMESYQITKTKQEIFQYQYVDSMIVPIYMSVIDGLHLITYENVLKTFDKYFRFQNWKWSFFN